MARPLIVVRSGPAALLLLLGACATPRPPPPPPPAPPAPPAALPAPPPVPVEVLLENAEAVVHQGGDVGQLDALLAEVRGRSPGDPRLPPLEAALAELRGDDAGAAEAWAQVLRAQPDPEVRLKRGLALARLGEDAEAEAELAAVLAERPEDRAAHAARAELLERGGRFPEAEAELSALVRLAPKDPAPLRRLAAFYRRRGAAARAVEAEQQARALEGPQRTLRSLKGRSEYRGPSQAGEARAARGAATERGQRLREGGRDEADAARIVSSGDGTGVLDDPPEGAMR